MGRDTSLWTRRLALGARDGHGQGSIGLLVAPKGTGHGRWVGPSVTTLRTPYDINGRASQHRDGPAGRPLVEVQCDPVDATGGPIEVDLDDHQVAFGRVERRLHAEQHGGGDARRTRRAELARSGSLRAFGLPCG